MILAITLSIFFIACFMGGIHFYNFVWTTRLRRIRTRIAAEVQAENSDKTVTSTGTAGVVGVAGVPPVVRIRMGRPVTPKAKSGDRYDLLKKEPMKEKSSAKRKNRYDLLKSKE